MEDPEMKAGKNGKRVMTAESSKASPSDAASQANEDTVVATEAVPRPTTRAMARAARTEENSA